MAKTVLVVDDSPSVRKMVQMTLAAAVTSLKPSMGRMPLKKRPHLT